MSPQSTPTDAPAPAAASVPQRPADVMPFARGVVILGRHVLSRLSLSTLSYLSSHPGATVAQLRDGLGASHLAQVGRMLGRLEDQGLVEHQQRLGQEAWALTVSGCEVLSQAQPGWAPAIGLDRGRRASGEGIVESDPSAAQHLGVVG